MRQLELETEFIVSKNGQYSIVFINYSNSDTEVQLDISLWQS